MVLEAVGLLLLTCRNYFASVRKIALLLCIMLLSSLNIFFSEIAMLPCLCSSVAVLSSQTSTFALNIFSLFFEVTPFRNGFKYT